VTEATEKEALAQKPHEVLPVQFIRVNDYTTFDCEFAILEGDIVFHFYVTEEVNQGPDPRAYWLEVFPAVLSKVAQEYFGATFPQIKAAYTEEKASWWMRAYGFGLKLDPHKYSYRFLDKLDDALEARKTT
jgi:hypothetical protein